MASYRRTFRRSPTRCVAVSRPRRPSSVRPGSPATSRPSIWLPPSRRGRPRFLTFPYEIGSGTMPGTVGDTALRKTHGDVVTFTSDPQWAANEGEEAEVTLTVKSVKERELLRPMMISASDGRPDDELEGRPQEAGCTDRAVPAGTAGIAIAWAGGTLSCTEISSPSRSSSTSSATALCRRCFPQRQRRKLRGYREGIPHRDPG